MFAEDLHVLLDQQFLSKKEVDIEIGGNSLQHGNCQRCLRQKTRGSGNHTSWDMWSKSMLFVDTRFDLQKGHGHAQVLVPDHAHEVVRDPGQVLVRVQGPDLGREHDRVRVQDHVLALGRGLVLDHVPLRVHDLAQELVHVQYLWPTALLHNMTSKARCPKWWLLPAEEVEKAKHCCFSQESATVQSGCLRDWSTKISAGKRVYQSATRTTVFHGNILASPENRRIQPVLICSNVMKCLMRLSGQGSLRNILDTFTVGLYLKQPAAMLIYHHVAGCVVFHNSKYPLHCSCLMMAFPCKSIYDYIYIFIRDYGKNNEQHYDQNQNFHQAPLTIVFATAHSCQCNLPHIWRKEQGIRFFLLQQSSAHCLWEAQLTKTHRWFAMIFS